MQNVSDNGAGLHRGRWGIALLLSFGVLVNYFDRVNLTVAYDALVHHFALSPVVFGYLAAAYSWTYCACQLPMGVALDRLGVRRIVLVGVLLFSMACFSGALATGLATLFASRFLLGIGESPTFPANAKAIGMWFPERDRSMATSIFDSSAKFASAIGVPVLGLLLLRIGWRWSFVSTGILSLLYLALFAVFYRNPTVSGTEQARLDSEQPLPLRALLKNLPLLALSFGFSAYCYVFYLLLVWLPTYLSSALHLALRDSFLFTGLPWLVATAAELLIGGWLVSALIRRGYDSNRVRRTTMVTGMICGLGILPVAATHSVGWALAWISLSIGGLAATAPVSWALLTVLVPRSSIGSAGGIVNFASQVAAIMAPIVTGYVIQVTHSFNWAFGIAGAFLLMGIVGYVTVLGRVNRVEGVEMTATAAD